MSEMLEKARNYDSIIKYQILENKRRPVFPLFSVKGD